MNNHTQDTVLVAGATGYLGGYVCRALKRSGYRVKALARNQAGLASVRPFVDEIFVGQAADDTTLEGLCRGVDVVFSSIGIHGTIPRKITVWDVDYGANMNILRRAQAVGVRHFIFISVINAERMRETIQVAEARERVGDALVDSGMTWTLLRPTGFFNDLKEFFDMVGRFGRAWLVGDGSARSNPIHGADLAQIAVDAIGDERWHNGAFDVGGPDIVTMRELVGLVFESMGKPMKLHAIPPGLARSMGTVLRSFHPGLADFLHFFIYEMLNDGIGETHGVHHMRDFFIEMVQESRTIED